MLGMKCASITTGRVVLPSFGLAQGFPDLWKRVQARRSFMRDVLGINLDDSVLPLSNTAGWLPLWALDLDTALIIN